MTAPDDDYSATLPRRLGEAYIANHWLMPGESARVMVYQSGRIEAEEAIRRARETIVAHEVEWVQLWSLQRQRVGKGPDGYRWVVTVEVRNPAPLPETQPEAML